PDGAGGAIIAWEDWRFWPVAHTFAQRVDADGTARWEANGTMVSQSANDQRGPALIPDGAGGAIIVWAEYSDGDIYAQRTSAAGQALWGANGVALCTADGGQSEPTI